MSQSVTLASSGMRWSRSSYLGMRQVNSLTVKSAAHDVDIGKSLAPVTC